MSLRVGSLVFACPSGLGYLAKSFYDHKVITDTLVVRHSHFQNYHAEWYPGERVITGRSWEKERRTVLQFCELMDIVLLFETPFYWQLIPHCKDHDIKTILMPMYECSPLQRDLPYQPDYFLCPSLLDQQYFPDRSVFLPVPVDTEKVPWRLRERMTTLVHNAGHGGLLGRNGTGDLLDAMRYIKSPVKLILRSQKRLQWDVSDSRVDVRVGTVPYDELWREGDAFIFPDHFDGLSLPLQEARASGMLVISGDRFPSNTWLPKESLVPVKGYEHTRVGGRCAEIDSAVFEPREIARVIDEWYGKDITSHSLSGKKWAESMSWSNLKTRYDQVLLNMREGRLP